MTGEIIGKTRGDVAHKYQRRLRFPNMETPKADIIARSNKCPAMTPAHRRTRFLRNQRQKDWRYFSQWNTGTPAASQVSENHRIRDELVL